MKSFLCPALVFFALTACSRQPATGAAQQSSSPKQSSAAAASLQAGQTVSGTVLETLDAASYTYVRVKTASGEIWAATGQMRLGVGDRVAVTVEMPANNFHSPSLNRDFPVLYFASRVEREGGPATSPMQGQVPPAGAMMAAHGQTGAATTTSETVTAKIAPPEGGISIADVWSRRAALAGKTVAVRGKVVKFNGGILDRNWIHIQDGSGNANDGTNDLTITSQALAKVGDVITVTGTVAMNRDIGSGYKYGVIVEKATIVTK